MGLSSSAGSFEMLIIGRLLIGINAGKYIYFRNRFTTSVTTPEIWSKIRMWGSSIGPAYNDSTAFPETANEVPKNKNINTFRYCILYQEITQKHNCIKN